MPHRKHGRRTGTSVGTTALEAKRKHVVVEVLARLWVLEAEEATEGWVEGDGEEGVLPVKLGVEAPGVSQAHDVHE